MTARFDSRDDAGKHGIDDSHQPLVVQISRLHQAISNGTVSVALDQIFEDLLAFAQSHFQQEEALMHQHGYPDLDAHKYRHDIFIARLVNLRARSQQGDVALTLMLFLQNWLIDHVLDADRALTEFLQPLAGRSTARAG